MTDTAPANLQDYVLAQVTAKTSEEHIRQLIDKKLDEAIQGAVNGDDSAITFYEALLRSAGQQKIDGTESSTSSERRST